MKGEKCERRRRRRRRRRSGVQRKSLGKLIFCAI